TYERRRQCGRRRRRDLRGEGRGVDARRARASRSRGSLPRANVRHTAALIFAEARRGSPQRAHCDRARDEACVISGSASQSPDPWSRLMNFALRSHATGLSAALALGCAGALGACVAADPPALDEERQAAQEAPHIEPRRSLAITEQPILARFSLE